MSAASAPQSMAWTTSDTRYESAGLYGTQELSPTDSLIPDVSIPDEQVHLSDDEDSRNDHLPTADSRKSWCKPLPAKERPTTPESTRTIPSSNVSDVKNNWFTALASTYVTPAKNTLLAKTRDMTNFLNWYCRQVNKTKLTHADLEGQAYEVVKAFYLDVINLLFQMKECHKPRIRLTGRIQKEIKLESIKGSSSAISNSKMKAASYLNFGLKLLVLEQIHDSLSRRNKVRSHMRILSVVRIKAYSRYGNFEDLNLLLLQGHLDHLPGSDKKMLSTAAKLWTRNIVIRQWVEDFQLVVFPVNNNKRKIIRFNEIYKFSEGTLTRILEALAYRVKEFKIKRLNLGMNTRFWTKKDVTRSKEFVAAIERRPKTRRIYQNLECFVGRRVCDIDYRLL
nr:hypothetical protein [Tanacetum cinerariifolium]